MDKLDFLPDAISAPEGQVKILAETGISLERYSSSDSNGANLPADVGQQLQDAIDKRQKGRASTFTVDKALTVLERIMDGETTEDACKASGVALSTWYVWRSVVPGLLEAATQAYEIQAEAQVDQADRMLREVDIESIEANRANAALRKVQQVADFRFNLAKCNNFKRFGDKKAQLNVNMNRQITDADVSRWFNGARTVDNLVDK